MGSIKKDHTLFLRCIGLWPVNFILNYGFYLLVLIFQLVQWKSQVKFAQLLFRGVSGRFYRWLILYLGYLTDTIWVFFMPRHVFHIDLFSFQVIIFPSLYTTLYLSFGSWISGYIVAVGCHIKGLWDDLLVVQLGQVELVVVWEWSRCFVSEVSIMVHGCHWLPDYDLSCIPGVLGRVSLFMNWRPESGSWWLTMALSYSTIINWLIRAPITPWCVLSIASTNVAIPVDPLVFWDHVSQFLLLFKNRIEYQFQNWIYTLTYTDPLIWSSKDTVGFD